MDWTSIIAAVIVAIPAMIAASAAIITTVKVDKTVKEVASIHVQINSRMDELLSVTQDESHARGIKAERERREAAEEDDSAQGEI